MSRARGHASARRCPFWVSKYFRLADDLTLTDSASARDVYISTRTVTVFIHHDVL